MTSPCPLLPLGVVILAAGASARMGRAKLLLPWGHTSVLGHLLGQWRTLGAAHIAVVTTPGPAALASELDRLGHPAADRILNPRPERGMFSSIRCVAQWTGWRANLTHWLITLGDQPQVRVDTLRALLDYAAAKPAAVCQPARAGRARHPVILPAGVFTQLRTATEPDLKQFLLAHAGERALCELPDAGLDFDLDVPADYERARHFA